MGRAFSAGDRVAVLKSPDPQAPDGGYPEGFVPPVFAGTVTGLLADLDLSAALFHALLDEYPDTSIADLPGVSAAPAADGPGVAVTVELERDEVVRLLARHPYYAVAVDGEDEPSVFRPDELERS